MAGFLCKADPFPRARRQALYVEGAPRSPREGVGKVRQGRREVHKSCISSWLPTVGIWALVPLGTLRGTVQSKLQNWPTSGGKTEVFPQLPFFIGWALSLDPQLSELSWYQGEKESEMLKVGNCRCVQKCPPRLLVTAEVGHRYGGWYQWSATVGSYAPTWNWGTESSKEERKERTLQMKEWTQVWIAAWLLNQCPPDTLDRWWRT